MVRTALTSRTHIRLIVAATASLTLGALAVITHPAAADDASTAYGVAATGVDPVGAQPQVSSDAAVKSASAGSVRSKAGTVTASGLAVKAGAGIAEASVANVAIGGGSSTVALGAVSASCNQGKATAGRSGTTKPATNMTVVYGTVSGGKATGATITITGAAGRVVETITVASVSCGTGTPPEPSPSPTTPAPPTGGTPTGQPTPPPEVTPAKPEPGKTTAPKPTPKPAHRPVAVTG